MSFHAPAKLVSGRRSLTSRFTSWLNDSPRRFWRRSRSYASRSKRSTWSPWSLPVQSGVWSHPLLRAEGGRELELAAERLPILRSSFAGIREARDGDLGLATRNEIYSHRWRPIDSPGPGLARTLVTKWRARMCERITSLELTFRRTEHGMIFCRRVPHATD